jgi:hypothetical protein
MREALIKIQIRMIKPVDHRTLYATVHVRQVADHAGHWIYLATNCYLNNIVMSVTVRIAALAVDRPVLFLAVSLRVQAM